MLTRSPGELTALVRSFGGLSLRDCASVVGAELRLRLGGGAQRCTLRLAVPVLDLLDERGFRVAAARLLASIA